MQNKFDSLQEMTPEEARAKHNNLKSLHRVIRANLLDIRDRKGWLALGYKSWEDYGEIEWGYSVNYLNRMASAGQVQSIIAPMSTREIPERQLRPLTSVPDEIKCKIWEQIASEHKKVTAKLIQEAVNIWKLNVVVNKFV